VTSRVRHVEWIDRDTHRVQLAVSEATPDLIDEGAVQRLIKRVEGFARGLGLDDASTRRIAEAFVADMPSRLDEEQMVEARTRMLIVVA
jgi:pantoate kinase